MSRRRLRFWWCLVEFRRDLVLELYGSACLSHVEEDDQRPSFLGFLCVVPMKKKIWVSLYSKVISRFQGLVFSRKSSSRPWEKALEEDGNDVSPLSCCGRRRRPPQGVGL